MSEKTVRSVLPTIVPMTVKEVVAKRTNTENGTAEKILSKLVQDIWSTTQFEMDGSQSLTVAKIVVTEQGCMDITMITPNRFWCDGSASPVTTNGTQNTDKG